MFNEWDEDAERRPDDWSDGSDAFTELSFGDADAWRGGVPDRTDAWRGGVEDATEPWRAGVHLSDWPAWDAGPEYHMWKKRAEGNDPNR